MGYVKLFEEFSTKIWYHGSEDSRKIESNGGFEQRTKKAEYISDLDKYYEVQSKMKNARETDENYYFELLDQSRNLKKEFQYNAPVFLSDEYRVARTYADPQRAFDYQNAEPKVYKIESECNNLVTISTYGDRFRFLNTDKIKRGFMNKGISEDDIDKTIKKFNFYTQNNKGLKTDTLAAIGAWYKFDCIDVKGVLDSYNGGTVKSTVRMVLDVNKIKIIRD